ncbi:hypothetical protein DFH06DRAFT_1135376 [Mycena polygramma]|nr:hypothetical protein DFH06DRAFT_1152249 [Mycena polygramma]KAJ7649131.1 hypothetical protein DFH06DRAFT_1135376 [Mycena polygramma]
MDCLENGLQKGKKFLVTIPVAIDGPKGFHFLKAMIPAMNLPLEATHGHNGIQLRNNCTVSLPACARLSRISATATPGRRDMAWNPRFKKSLGDSNLYRKMGLAYTPLDIGIPYRRLRIAAVSGGYSGAIDGRKRFHMLDYDTSFIFASLGTPATAVTQRFCKTLESVWPVDCLETAPGKGSSSASSARNCCVQAMARWSRLSVEIKITLSMDIVVPTVVFKAQAASNAASTAIVFTARACLTDDSEPLPFLKAVLEAIDGPKGIRLLNNYTVSPEACA